MNSNLKRTLLALVPLAVLILLLSLDISIFGADSILGASQVALLTGAGVCIGLAMWLYKIPWKQFEQAISAHIGDVSTAIRVAVTGRRNTPDLHAIMNVLGEGKVRARLADAIAYYEG